jgi:hypothetical protein
MNSHARNAQKKPAPRKWQFIKRIIQHHQVEFIPGMQDWITIQKSIDVLHHSNTTKEQNHMTISIAAELFLNDPTSCHN